MLRLLGAGAAAGWVAPLVLSTPAIAQTSPGGGTTTTTGGGPPTPNGKLFDYTGGDRALSGLAHTQLATANSLTYTSGATLPADLASYNCIVLSAHRVGFSAGEVALLAAALTAGRTVIYETDSRVVAGSNAMSTVFNAVATGLGIGVTDDNADLDFSTCYLASVTNAAEPLTLGFTSISYNLTSRLTLTASARSLLTGVSGQVLAAAQTVGTGTFVAIADVNIVSDAALSVNVPGNECYTSAAVTRFRQNLC
ncbi:MAG: hypothetical protein MUF83_00075 [Acidimicrobiales bacterium]|nr:hypothetical protein [Acidimicrobiales bacterium]